jgi:hypothetical protein
MGFFPSQGYKTVNKHPCTTEDIFLYSLTPCLFWAVLSSCESYQFAYCSQSNKVVCLFFIFVALELDLIYKTASSVAIFNPDFEV